MNGVLGIVDHQEVHHVDNVVVEGLRAANLALGVDEELAELVLLAYQLSRNQRVLI